jgi:hypothetical protein
VRCIASSDFLYVIVHSSNKIIAVCCKTFANAEFFSLSILHIFELLLSWTEATIGMCSCMYVVFGQVARYALKSP